MVASSTWRRLSSVLLLAVLATAALAQPSATQPSTQPATQPAFTHVLTLHHKGQPHLYRLSLPDGWERNGGEGTWKRVHPPGDDGLSWGYLHVSTPEGNVHIDLARQIQDLYFAATLKPEADHFVGTWEAFSAFGSEKNTGAATLTALPPSATRPSQ